MKGKVLSVLAVAAVVALTLLAARGPSALAQPVADIILPPPGSATQLYAGCNNVSLTFPDGTPSQQVVQAVTPPGSVESLWRHSAALARFEGFNPAFPGASDLLSVNFLDAAWLCMAEVAPGATSPPPPPAPPPPTPTPPTSPPPPPVPTQGDLVLHEIQLAMDGEILLRVETDPSGSLSASFRYQVWVDGTFVAEDQVNPPVGSAVFWSGYKISGTHTVRAVIDGYYEVPETDETNNELIRSCDTTTLTCKLAGGSQI